jgi:nucleoside-diphosphate-sugar epimerase
MKSATVKWDSDEVCLVTGGTGFIGSYLVRELVNQGKKVIVYDFTPDASYIIDCIGKVTFVYGDVADMPHLVRVMSDHDVKVVFHLAYLLVPDTDNKLGTAIQVNCAGFHNVMEAARVTNVRRVVWPSSQAVYGLAEFYPDQPLNEDVFVNPTTLYGACKLFNEHVARFYRRVHNLDNIGFRKSVVYGLGKSRRRDLSVSHLLIENALLGRPLEMLPVDYYANYVYVKDVVRAYLLAAQAPQPKHIIFNIGGYVHRNSEVVDLMKKLVPGVTVHYRESHGIPNPIDAYALDQSRAREELDYEPAYTLEEGVKDQLKMMKELGDQYKSAKLDWKVTPLT